MDPVAGLLLICWPQYSSFEMMGYERHLWPAHSQTSVNCGGHVCIDGSPGIGTR